MALVFLMLLVLGCFFGVWIRPWRCLDQAGGVWIKPGWCLDQAGRMSGWIRFRVMALDFFDFVGVRMFFWCLDQAAVVSGSVQVPKKMTVSLFWVVSGSGRGGVWIRPEWCLDQAKWCLDQAGGMSGLGLELWL